jgi:hypothetical protein
MSDHHPTSQLDAIFKPTSVAVVGASTRAGTVGNDIIRNLLFNEFNGSVSPINPRANNVHGVVPYNVPRRRRCFPSRPELESLHTAQTVLANVPVPAIAPPSRSSLDRRVLGRLPKRAVRFTVLPEKIEGTAAKTRGWWPTHERIAVSRRLPRVRISH